MKRVLCVWFPRWPIQRFRHARPRFNNRALVISSGAERGKRLVTACCPAASQEGIVPGMSRADAQALCPAAHFVRHEPLADAAALRELASWCAVRFSPVVAVESGERPESLLLDITGCAHLFGGERALAETVQRQLHSEGYRGVVAVADTIGLAWALAHFGTAAGSAQQPTLAPAGSGDEALQPLPIEALRLSPAVVDLLRKFDIRRVAQLLQLPRAELPARFGAEVLHRIDQALGMVPELLVPHQVVEPLEARWNFEPATADRAVLEAVLEHLLEKMLARLRQQQLGVRRLACSLRTEAGSSVPLRIGLVQASNSTRHLMELLRLQCERIQLPRDVCTLKLRAEGIVPLEFHQQEFVGEASGSQHLHKLPGLIERLSNRLGENAVLRPCLRPEVLPEQAFRLEPWLQPTSARRLATPNRLFRVERPSRPLPRPPCLLAQPIAIPTVAIGGDGPPRRFEWQEQGHVVVHSWGPERLETGWWRGPQQRRDYYLVETSTAQRFWLFRNLDDHQWYLHGSFA